MRAPAVTLAARASAPGLIGERPSELACAHCGLPVLAAGPLPQSSDPAFCCSACSLAYRIIQDAGLGGYYLQRAQSEAGPERARGSGKAFTELDDPSFRERYLKLGPNGASLELFLEGVHCTACVWLVERLPRVVPGVHAARLDLSRALVNVEFDPERASPSAIARALDSLGYRPHVSPSAQRAGQRERDRALLTKLGVAGALAGNIMLMAFALYCGAASQAEYAALFRWGSFALAIPAVFYAGSPFLRGGYAALRTRTPHMDLPVSIGILAGFARSAYNTLTARGEVYFDSIAVLIFLLLVGRWLQQRHHRGATQALDLIAALAPASARLLEGDALRDVPAESLAQNSVVRVAAGECLPADGIVLRGASSIDSSWLTGESLPADVKPGDRVYAGARNLSAELDLRVEAAGHESRLGRLLYTVEQAQARRAPIVRLADQVSGYFVLVVLGLSALTFAGWCFVDPARALDHAVALLVVTCPCALGMATPLAVSAALRRAARAGIFFKGGEFLEALARPGTIAFDKTGTLTEGRLTLASFVGDQDVKSYLRAAELGSAHPIGRALVAALSGGPELCAEEVHEQIGAGVIARVGGREVRIGSAALVRRHSDTSGAPWERELTRQAARGRPAVAASLDGQVCAIASFSDPLRPDARASLDALRAAGYELAILSGDQPLVVDAVARELGPLTSAEGGMSPEDKLAWVERASVRGPVVMVGDGINDAAAMAAARVSIAVHGGAEASLLAADIFTTEPGVGKVLEAVSGARRTLRAIRRGIAFSLAYNVAGVVLCMGGWISPLLAAVLMPLSSLTVVTGALRARTFDAKPKQRTVR